MSVFRVIYFLACAALVVSCGNGQEKSEQLSRVPDLLSTVPSDALAVVCYGSCAEGMAMLDSTDILRKMDFSQAKDVSMALSLCYNGSIVPVLAIDGGQSQHDTSSVIKALMRQASELKLQMRYLGAGNQVKGRNVLLVTPSEAQMAATMRHIEENTSILDANGFMHALSLVGNHDFTIFRNNGGRRYIPSEFLSGIFPNSQTSAFLGRLSEWTVFEHTPESKGYTIKFSDRGFGDEFASMMSAVPSGKSRLMSILPEEYEFAFSIMTPPTVFRKAYEAYLDANVRLDKYRSRLASLKSSAGLSPLDWEKQLGICEAGLIRVSGESLILVRPSKTLPDEAPHANPFSDFPAALYGSAFELPDNSFTATMHGWILSGSQTAVNRLFGLAVVNEDKDPEPAIRCKFFAQYKNYSLVWGNKDIRLWNTHR